MTTPRNEALDGLRGLAALAVALGHCNLAVTGLALWSASARDFGAMTAREIAERLLYVVFPGDAAVVLFFVLSGHVLWESFARKDVAGFSGIADYALGRGYRLLPVAIASALPLGLFSNYSAHDLVANMLLLSNSINGVLWSLQVEAVCSLAIFLAWLVVRHSPFGLALLLLLSIAAIPIFHNSAYGGVSVLFFPAFLLGAAISAIPERVWRLRSVFFIGLGILVLANVVLSRSSASRLVEMIGAMAVVGATRARPLGVLTSRPVLFLGAISYPFYLSHATGLLLSDQLGFTGISGAPFTEIAILAAISIPATIAIAWILHVAVELPAMQARPRFPAPIQDGPRAAIRRLK